MATLAKLVTVKMTVWTKNGLVMLARSNATGKWIKREDAQYVVDGLAMYAALANRAPTTTKGKSSALDCYATFCKSVEWLGAKSIEYTGIDYAAFPHPQHIRAAFTSNA